MAVYGRHHFTQRTKFRYRGAKNSGYRAEKMRSSGVDTLTKINHPQFSSRCVCSSSFRFPVSDRRMDVPIVGKSELGGKYEAGIRRRRRRHLDCRHWQRRRKRRKEGGDGGGGGGGKLTEVVFHWAPPKMMFQVVLVLYFTVLATGAPPSSSMIYADDKVSPSFSLKLFLR
uniref:Uncharacterized protein n=1 Tax=Vespula pensylvanica TaxID=30213 RepID=A0A834JK93_VESPE|nr:hypothetical protein H0235_017966 [Vespula pensylvanica]